MRVDPNLNPGGVDGTVAPKRPARSAPAAVEPASFAGADALDTSMLNAPDSRPAAVDRARALIQDANYPPPEVLRGVANLLATKLASSSK
jgi:hypothetical protein